MSETEKKPIQLTINPEGFWSGNEADWNTLVESVSPILTSVLRRTGLRTADLVEIRQETFLRAFETRLDIDPSPNIVFFLCEKGRRLAIDRLRRNNFEIDESDFGYWYSNLDVLDVSNKGYEGRVPYDVDEQAISSVYADQVREPLFAAIEELPERERRIILYTADNRQTEDVLNELHMTRSALKSQRLRTRRRLMQKLADVV